MMTTATKDDWTPAQWRTRRTAQICQWGCFACLLLAQSVGWLLLLGIVFGFFAFRFNKQIDYTNDVSAASK